MLNPAQPIWAVRGLGRRLVKIAKIENIISLKGGKLL